LKTFGTVLTTRKLSSCWHDVNFKNNVVICCGVTADKLEKKVREFYDIVCRLEEEKYDWEFKLRKMDFEVWHAPQTVPDTL